MYKTHKKDMKNYEEVVLLSNNYDILCGNVMFRCIVILTNSMLRFCGSKSGALHVLVVITSSIL